MNGGLFDRRAEPRAPGFYWAKIFADDRRWEVVEVCPFGRVYAIRWAGECDAVKVWGARVTPAAGPYNPGEWSAREPAPGYRVDKHPADPAALDYRLWRHGVFVTAGDRVALCEQSWREIMHHDDRIKGPL